ncbi:pyridoxamine 5'-phosphate oxidase family protein [Kitasatospora sp. NPDC048365]|uniref:pyridoxamine 5'-phosphate oxidase family protein n=1 Tax=Kitasatospora sp. NPDC048365 TaxID=3364050 RepID=UPI00371DE4CE
MDTRLHPDDPQAVARRITDRLAQLGIGPDSLAREAGMSPQYLAVLTVSGPGLDPNGFLRIAAALGLTYRELIEGRADLPPGQSPPGPRPALLRLGEAECWERLGNRGVGRIVLPAEPAPLAFPVNYTVDGRTVVYRTDPDGAAAAPDGTAVSFQVDRIDEHRSHGWSVLLTGTAERITDPTALHRLEHDPAAEPWAGGPRPLWIRVRSQRISGRRITGPPNGRD